MAGPAARPVCPVLLIDAIVLKVRDGNVGNRPVYVAMGITLDGERDVLGMWVGPGGGEGAKQWMNMLTDLKNRGILDVCIVCCDDLKGLPDAITATWPLATVQTCVVHLVRNSLRYASRKYWAAITTDLRCVYTAPSLPAAQEAFETFADNWGASTRHGRLVAAFLGGVHSVPRLPPRGPQADLHHEQHRYLEPSTVCR